MRPRPPTTRWWLDVPLGVKLDEDLSPLVGAPLAAAGHTVATVLQQGWSGLDDVDLWSKVCAEGLLFVTADRAFGDIRTFPPGTHRGIVVLRADRESIAEYGRLVEAVLAKHDLEELVGTITVATPRSIRVRRNPP